MVAIEDMKSGWTSSLSDSVIDTNNLGFCDKKLLIFASLFDMIKRLNDVLFSVT